METAEQAANKNATLPFFRSRKFNLVIYCTAVALFWTSLYLYVPTLPVYIKEKVGSLGAVGLILSMYGLWQAILRFPLGIASDRIGWRKPFILSGFILSAVGALVMGTGATGLSLGVGRAITGLAAATWVPLVVVFSSLFPPKDAVRATAILTMVNSFSIMMAMSLTGWLNHLGGYSLAFYAAIGAAGAALLVVLAAGETRTEPKKVELQGLTRIVLRPDVIRPAVLAALYQFVVWSTTLSFTAILAKRLGASDVMISILSSSGTGVVLLGNLMTATLVYQIGKKRMVGVSFITLSMGAFLAALSPSLAWLFAAQYLVSFSSGILQPLLMGMSIEKVEGNERATAMGLYQAVYGIGMFTGPFVGGRIADWLGLQPMFAVSGIICLVLGMLGVRWMVGGFKFHQSRD